MATQSDYSRVPVRLRRRARAARRHSRWAAIQADKETAFVSIHRDKIAKKTKNKIENSPIRLPRHRLQSVDDAPAHNHQ